MPPRKSHKKSRTGCHRCKQRKVKCDEIRPACGNCLKHGVSCDFDEPRNVAPVRPQGQPNHLSVVQIRSSSTPQFQLHHQPTNSFPLKLFHNYMVVTAKAFANSPTMRELMTCVLPKWAFDSPYLLSTILATSALHLRLDHPHDQSIIRASHEYMVLALSQFSSALTNGVNASNTPAIFATSVFIARQAAAYRRFEVIDRDYGPDAKYKLPVEWFNSCQGLTAVVTASWKWLKHCSHMQNLCRGLQLFSMEENIQRPRFFDFLLEGLDEQLEGIEDSRRKETRYAYEHAVAYLTWVHKKQQPSTAIWFVCVLSKRFIRMAERYDPRALVILSSFLAMVGVFDVIWGFEGFATLEILGIQSVLPTEWKGKMDWAIRIMNHKGPLNDETWGIHWDPLAWQRLSDRTYQDDTQTFDDPIQAAKIRFCGVLPVDPL